MDFFERQDRAHRNTRRLVFYFVLATVLIVAAVMGLVGLIAVSSDPPRPGISNLDWATDHSGLFALTGLGTLGLIGLGSLSKIASLRGGGGAVARELGGTRVESDDYDPAKRRLMNVVEEMAVASGVPVPEVYVLENEMGINAFAAGFTSADAAVAVTRGTMERLSRDELQGVIAHEFSHIFNGDMRLNMRLIGVLAGILLIGMTGQMLFRSMAYAGRIRVGRREEGAGIAVGVITLGLALIILGSIGVFFGRLIKAAVSRQREFLADASAVQFTRNPDGLAGALKKIGGFTEGSSLQAARTEEVSHMLFGSGGRSFIGGLFATHPPLVDRIRAVDPSFDPREFKQIRQKFADEGAGEKTAGLAGEEAPRRARVPLAAATVADLVGNPGQAQFRYAGDLLARLPESVREAVMTPRHASLLVLALVLGKEVSNRSVQLGLVQESLGVNMRGPVEKLAQAVDQLGPAYRLPVLDVAFPALRRLPPGEVSRLMDLVQRMAGADGRIDFFEFVLARMLQTHLYDSLQPVGMGPKRYASLDRRRTEARTLLSAVAQVGQEGDEAIRAYSAAVERLGSAEVGSMEPMNLLQLDRALVRLDDLAPGDKRSILEAMVTAISADGTVTVEEGEILRAVCDTLHIPLPPLEA